jgi:hypothetical protein
VRLVATSKTTAHVLGHGGAVYVWPKASRCCGGRAYTLEAATDPPNGAFHPIGSGRGIEVWGTQGLPVPTELHLELNRRGALRAFWDGQGWIG